MTENFQCTKQQLEELNKQKKQAFSYMFSGLGSAAMSAICAAIGIYILPEAINSNSILGLTPLIAGGGGILVFMKQYITSRKKYKKLKSEIKELEGQMEGKVR